MDKSLIYHIYWGTSGNSGLYLDEIYQCLKESGYNQKVFVSHYYPFNYGERIFFRRSDMAHCKCQGVRRKILQLYEIIVAFAKILLSSYKEKPEIINYSLISGSYSFVIYFLWMLKVLSNCKLVVTCHDVTPWGNPDKNSTEIVNRQKIFNMADYLLVHNNSSISDLEKVFSIDKGKIVKHLFPIMDLSKIIKTKPTVKKCDFLFIGHLRKDKGIDFLIDSWKLFHKKVPDARLWVCGRPQGQNFNIEELKELNITCNLGYISDDDYCNYIQSTRYVILPYLMGTNSGIISTVMSLGANVITSDIPMFQDNPLVPRQNMFSVGCVNSLVDMMFQKYYKQDSGLSGNKLGNYRKCFKSETLNAYSLFLS